jgi:hypothetical protein
LLGIWREWVFQNWKRDQLMITWSLRSYSIRIGITLLFGYFMCYCIWISTPKGGS